MRIVIEIPNKDIPKHQELIDIPLHFIDGKVCEAGGYGFEVLPKGHGRLIDADALKKDDEVTEWLSLNAVRTGKMLKSFSELFVKKIDATPTIIEADKESEDNMADIELVIKIDEKTYNVIKGFGDIPIGNTYEVAMAIINGTPLDEPFINKPCISEGVCHEDKVKVLNKIRNDVKQLLNANPSYWNKCDVVNRYEVLAIIDKYTKGDAE